MITKPFLSSFAASLIVLATSVWSQPNEKSSTVADACLTGTALVRDDLKRGLEVSRRKVREVQSSCRLADDGHNAQVQAALVELYEYVTRPITPAGIVGGPQPQNSAVTPSRERRSSLPPPTVSPRTSANESPEEFERNALLDLEKWDPRWRVGKEFPWGLSVATGNRIPCYDALIKAGKLACRVAYRTIFVEKSPEWLQFKAPSRPVLPNRIIPRDTWVDVARDTDEPDLLCLKVLETIEYVEPSKPRCVSYEMSFWSGLHRECLQWESGRNVTFSIVANTCQKTINVKIWCPNGSSELTVLGNEKETREDKYGSCVFRMN